MSRCQALVGRLRTLGEVAADSNDRTSGGAAGKCRTSWIGMRSRVGHEVLPSTLDGLPLDGPHRTTPACGSAGSAPALSLGPRFGAGAGLANLLGPSQRADIDAGIAAGGGRWSTRQTTQSSSRWQPYYRWRSLTGRWRRAWQAHRWHDYHDDTTRISKRGNG